MGEFEDFENLNREGEIEIRVHVIFVGKMALLLLAGLRGWFLGTVDSRFRGNDSRVVGVINGETIANGPKNLPTILTGTLLSIDELRYVADRWRMDYNHYSGRPSLPDIAAWTIWHRQH